MRKCVKILELLIVFIAACSIIWFVSGIPGNVVSDSEIESDDFYILDGPETENTIEVSEPVEPTPQNMSVTSYTRFAEEFNGEEYNIPLSSQLGLSTHLVMVFQPDELPLEVLENRNGAVVIEMLISRIDSVETGDGTVLNTDSEFNYISFREYLKTNEAKDGDIMLTYCVYDPSNNYEDDIVIRFDCPIGGE